MSRQHRHSNLRILQRWGAIALLEIGLSLALVAIAPVFLNSNSPWIGFLLWGFVLVLLFGSGVYLLTRLLDVHQARQIFVTRFPKYRYLSWIDFLDLQAKEVAANLDMLAAVDSDTDFQDLQVSLMDLLRRAKSR